MLTLTKKVLTKPNHETPSVTHFGSRIIINLILKLRFVQNTTNQKLIFKSSYLKLVLSSFILVAAPPTTNKQTITIIKSRNHLLSPTFHYGRRGSGSRYQQYEHLFSLPGASKYRPTTGHKMVSSDLDFLSNSTPF